MFCVCVHRSLKVNQLLYSNARVQKIGCQVMACQSTKLSRHRCYVITFETAAWCFNRICNSSYASLQVGIYQ
jgi:hypothetical protein